MSLEDAEASERSMSYEELAAVDAEPPAQAPQSDADLWAVLENGIRDISGEVRNSLDFHRSQEGGGEVSHVVMSGRRGGHPRLCRGPPELARRRGPSRRDRFLDEGLAEVVSPHRLAVATGLAASEAPQ